jgi:hypothetical protein
MDLRSSFLFFYLPKPVLLSKPVNLKDFGIFTSSQSSLWKFDR